MPETQFIGSSAVWISPVCKTRTALLDRLAWTVERLGSAKLTLRTNQEQSVRDEIASLRGACENIRQELQAHRLTHHC
jgi:hypothetical protein